MSISADELGPTATPCLSEEDVLAFAAGHLSATRRGDAHLHFDECEVCQALLSEAVHALATAPTAGFGSKAEPAWSTTFRSGTVVGQRYDVRQFIARGGMGEVYEAFDRDLQQRVALKTVTSTAGDNPSAVRRLKAEVQLARRVSHPNVCRIYDFGTHLPSNDGPQVSFLTMEFVEGETLGKRLRRTGALPVEEACAVARQLLLGLKAAHDAGVLHRDFKSDNVMLRKDGERVQPLILDFGLARALDHEAHQSSSSNQGLVGTFAYMAPEQLEGKPFSTASDVYSLGLVWFEMLTGELPFKPTSSPALPALTRLTRPVPPPSSKQAQVPKDLDALVLACLRRSSTDRLQTADEVLARLDALESRKPVRPRRRTLAPWAIAVGLLVGVGYFASSARERAASVSASEPPRVVPQAPAAPPSPVNAAPVAPAAVTPRQPARPAEQPSKRRSSAGSPAAKPDQQDREPKRPEQRDTSSAPRATDATHGWENPFPEKG